MKRKRKDSSADSSSLRTTRSNAPVTNTPKDSPKKRTSARQNNGDVEETTTPTISQTLSQKASNARLRSQSQRNTPSAALDVVIVGSAIKKRNLVSTPSKSLFRRNASPTQSDISSPSAEINVKRVDKKNVYGNKALTPVTRNTRDLHEEIADGESKQMLSRGIRRNKIDRDEDDFSEEEEEEEFEEEEDEDEEEERDKVEREKVATTAAYDNYFQYAAKKRKSLTTNNTLSLLPTLTPQESTSLLTSIPDHHATETKNLQNAHRQQFTQWKFEIDNGYNILLFGYGSKRSLIEHSVKKY